MIFVGILIGTTIIASFVARLLGASRLNPIMIVGTPWCLMCLTASVPGMLSPGLSAPFWIVAGLGLGSFYFGAVAGQVVVVSETPSKLDICGQKIVKYHLVLVALLLGSVSFSFVSLWPLIQQAGGVREVFLNGTGDAGSQYRNSQISLADSGSSISVLGPIGSILSYLLFMGQISIVTGAILWCKGRRVLAALPLIVLAGYSLASVQRTSFMLAAIMFFLAVQISKYWTGHRESGGVRSKVRDTLLLVAGLVVVIGVSLASLAARSSSSNSSGGSGLSSLFQYFLSGAAGLNAQFAGSNSSQIDFGGIVGRDSLGFGAYTFKGLFAILSRLNPDIFVPPINLEYWPVIISGESTMTNVATLFLDLLLDFGPAGLIFVPVLAGFATTVALEFSKRKSITWAPAALVACTVGAWSFFVNAVLADGRFIFLALAGGPLLAYIIKRSGYSARSTLQR